LPYLFSPVTAVLNKDTIENVELSSLFIGLLQSQLCEIINSTSGFDRSSWKLKHVSLQAFCNDIDVVEKSVRTSSKKSRMYDATTAVLYITLLGHIGY
jgi:hypothetical protein